ncbi:MAG TPA: winged helix-turn-helix domain-containing protein [Candidatus Dormibacteraeota bacterium]|nr:winged helix-turn-helix domain-containing protein [Candidatus Dormibacteraeota bacterium]HVC23279.1 winged helix-turn-helix domain-containing protein [Candidatus Dormibacteraeota bacterium]
MPAKAAHDRGPSALRLRALAHPLRWKLIDLLGSERTATATRCAEATGESVASCSYHLGVLGKYEYIQLVPGIAGREKPWRLTSRRQDLSSPGPDLEDQLASEAATEVFLDHELERIKSRVRTRGLEPPEWRQATSGGGSTIWVTAAELGEIKEELLAILRRYESRAEDPRERPADARAARVFVSTSVHPTR